MFYELQDLLPAALAQPYASVQAFVEAGGWVLYLILAAGIILWTLLLERYWFFARLLPRRVEALCRDWQARKERRSWSARRIRAAMISEANVAMEATLPVIRNLIAICPLLGLLGTVTGMIEVFDVMSLKGTSDARAMAAGVSRATVPTMAGMMVGLSGLFLSHRFSSRVRVATEELGDRLAYR